LQDLFLVHICNSVWSYYPTVKKHLAKIHIGKVNRFAPHFYDSLHLTSLLEIHSLVSEITVEIQMVASLSISENIVKLKI